MYCAICLRPASGRLQLTCTNCARNTIYEPRLLHAQALLQKEALGREVENVLSTGHRQENELSLQKTIKSKEEYFPSRLSIERPKSEQLDSDERTQNILTHVEALRAETKQIKADISKRKLSLNQRRSTLAGAKKELLHHQAVDLQPIQKSITKIEHRWEALQNKSAESRVFLCREAANLYSLQQRRRKKGVTGRDTYMIGGIPIVDLRDINTADPTQITVTITHLAHLIHLTSHYLSLRLPAEISLPNATHPYPTISSPLSSYTAPSIPTSLPTKSPSSLPRTRPLHLDKPLPTLAKEDPLAYSLFVDAIALLAWDIAWVCKTQGLDPGAKSWEEICALGRNIWLLLIAPPSSIRPSPSSLTSTTNAPATTPGKPLSRLPENITVPSTTGPTEVSKPPLVASLGYLSHSSSRAFLAAANAAEYMSSWRLANPIRFIDKVKAALASERMGAEWELLEDGEWEEEAVGEGKRVGEGEGGKGEGGKGEGGKGEGKEKEKDKDRGTSGWTKLKSRGVDGGA